MTRSLPTRLSKWALTLCFVLGFGLLSANGSEASATWLTANSPKLDLGNGWSTKSHTELRMPDLEYLSYVRISQKFNYKINDSWTLGTHPTLERSRSNTKSDWSNTYRFDLELNPKKIKIGESGPTLSMRNRWELRWKEGKGSEIFHRVRQQSKLSWKLDNAFVKSYSLGNEVFYEVDKERITLNRFYPIILGVDIFESVGTSFYLMYQSKRSGLSSDWNGTYVSGISLKF
ncbi:DUF2490 domain-containing protein [Puniceicoccaceae bacterium K14]|nr:DUF2490 domain-containing protein [Puniceicoccaceae bacterium K14]